MEEIIKLRCPHCEGKIGIDITYYKELVGEEMECPHCQKKMKIPSTVRTIKKDQDTIGAHGRHITQKVHKTEVGWAAAPLKAKDDDAAYCPRCKEEVGKRDRVCIACGATLFPH